MQQFDRQVFNLFIYLGNLFVTHSPGLCQSVCMHICIIYLYVCLSVSMFVCMYHLSICLSLSQSVGLSVSQYHLSLYLSLSQAVCMYKF